MDEAQEAELAASIEGVSALNDELGAANTGRRARMKAAAAEDDAAELQVTINCHFKSHTPVHAQFCAPLFRRANWSFYPSIRPITLLWGFREQFLGSGPEGDKVL